MKSRLNIRALILPILLLLPVFATAQNAASGCFDIAVNSTPVPLFISNYDYPGVIRTMEDLRDDLELVTGTKPDLNTSTFKPAPRIVIAGTIGNNPQIDQLISDGKIDVSEVAGGWEAYQIQVLTNPFPDVQEALVIVGSDKRGTIYGIYEISKQIGVNPWYFWADVPVKTQTDVTVLPDCKLTDKPSVQYRGIFLNDENPSLYGWVNERYGGFNHEFYADVFELILRLKGNYLWPAMWGKAFYDDDPLNARTADLYGVVMGTSHHEPMGRAHVEWDRYGSGSWNYQTNEDTLRQFWIDGIKRIGEYEATISLGMRGDGDMAMSEDTNIELLQKIVADQREILKEYSKQDPDKELQLWALYKEVQDYYEKGMRVPDDVMLLLADDNWGNLRLLPEPGKADEHPGGWGIYYHFDYVGGPRNYKWINTSQVSRIWEQMHLAWEYDVDRMWLVNVGDLKPMEFPISFFLDYAWDPEAMQLEDMEDYSERWATDIFGPYYGSEIARILDTYTKYNARRKPELLSPETYSLANFLEAENIVKNYNRLEEYTRVMYQQIPAEYKDAFYQLVMHPVEASANLNELYVTAAKNQLYAQQKRSLTNVTADLVLELFIEDQIITNRYHSINDGKWNHMMDQTHIGYTYWQQPEQNNMPDTVKIRVPREAKMGISIEGTNDYWTENPDSAITLPVFDKFNQQRFHFEIFNQGEENFDYTVTTSVPWIELSSEAGTIVGQNRDWVSINWEEVPAGMHSETITVNGAGTTINIQVPVFSPETDLEGFTGFVEGNNYVSIEPEHFSRKITQGDSDWMIVPQMGRTLSSVTPVPVTDFSEKNPGDIYSPRLEYDIYFFSTGEFTVKTDLMPTLEFNQSKGLRFAISFDDEEPQIINVHEDYSWGRIVADYRNQIISKHTITEPGEHILKIWTVDPGIAVQKIVVETGEVGDSYLGPPESFRKK